MRVTINRLFNLLIGTPLMRVLQIFAQRILVFTGWSTDDHTIEYLRGKRRAVLIALHSTYWDAVIGIMFQLAYRLPMVYVTDIKYMHIPIIGTTLSLLGFMGVGGKGDTKKVVTMLNSREDYLFIIMPEGRVSRGNKWHSGYYHIARECGIDIIPMAYNFNKHTLTVDRLGAVIVGDRSLEEVQKECQMRLCKTAIPLHLGNTYPIADCCKIDPSIHTSLFSWNMNLIGRISSFILAVSLIPLAIFITIVGYPLLILYIFTWITYRSLIGKPVDMC